jgi:hypothetical protein
MRTMLKNEMTYFDMLNVLCYTHFLLRLYGILYTASLALSLMTIRKKRRSHDKSGRGLVSNYLYRKERITPSTHFPTLLVPYKISFSLVPPGTVPKIWETEHAFLKYRIKILKLLQSHRFHVK